MSSLALEIDVALQRLDHHSRLRPHRRHRHPRLALRSGCKHIGGPCVDGRECRAYGITHVAAAILLQADTFLRFDVRQRMLAASLGLSVVP